MTVKKRGLGKGLSALISEEMINEGLSSNESIINIKIDLINPNKNQPRLGFDEEKLSDLTSSIMVHGLIQPIIVKKVKNKYEIIAGERRWRASRQAGLKEIPCILMDINEETSAKLAIIENVQREDLNPIEEARAYEKLIKNYSLTQEEVAKEVGKSRPYISNTIRLLNLSEEIIEQISKGELTAGHGKVLLSIKDKQQQSITAKEIIDNNLNVRESEVLTKDGGKAIKRVKTTILNDPQKIHIEDNLMQALGTKVNLVLGNKKGKIEIEYYGSEDLERIIDILTK